MTEEKRLAESYRIGAERLRMLADMDGHGKTHDTLIWIAKGFDRMAETLESEPRRKAFAILRGDG